MNSNMIKPEKFGNLHSIHYFRIPLRGKIFHCIQLIDWSACYMLWTRTAPWFWRKKLKIHQGIPKLENKCNRQDTCSNAACHRILSPYQQRFTTWSEQFSEAIHHNFKQTWKHFKINNIQNKNYGKHFLQAVSTYNKQHL